MKHEFSLFLFLHASGKQIPVDMTCGSVQPMFSSTFPCSKDTGAEKFLIPASSHLMQQQG